MNNGPTILPKNCCLPKNDDLNDNLNDQTNAGRDVPNARQIPQNHGMFIPHGGVNQVAKTLWRGET